MSTERDAPAGASGSTGPTSTRTGVRPRLKPPPRLVVPPPREHRPAAGGGEAATRSAQARSAQARSATATWITVAFFAVLAVAALVVFFVLPDWVRARQASAAAAARAPATELVTTATAVEPAPAAPEPTVPGPAPAAEAQAPPPPAPPRSAPPPPATPSVPAARPQKPAGGRAFGEAMSDGLAALDRGDYAAAREAFSRAGGLRPGSPQSADGLARAEAGERLAKIRTLRQEALAFEAQEDWHAAAQRYGAALELDPTVEFAQAGHRRGQRRAKLADGLDFHLANRQRLSSDEVLQEAAAILEQASEIEAAGPRLRRQREQLAQAVAAYSTPVTATLASDELTEVVVYRVGRLGTFSRRALELRPGTYTVVGSRQGYRDVRRQLVIEPGVEPRPLEVRCQEKI